jgi:hypothetical protein
MHFIPTELKTTSYLASNDFFKKLALTQIKDKVTNIDDMHLDLFVFLLLNSYELISIIQDWTENQ